jgi:hypothetical protein
VIDDSKSRPGQDVCGQGKINQVEGVEKLRAKLKLHRLAVDRRLCGSRADQLSS